MLIENAINVLYPINIERKPSEFDAFALGMTHSEIIADYPAVEDADILACLEFAA